MEAKEFGELVKALFDGTIDNRRYQKLFSYLAGIINRKSKGNLNYQDIKDLTSAFILKLLESKERISTLLSEPSELRAYISTSARNFLIDFLKKDKSRKFEIAESDMSQEEEEKTSFMDRVAAPEIVRTYELMELKETFKKKVKTENVKYFCYMLDSKRYKCLWGNKSDDAIYKDVSRKRRVVEEFGDELKRLGITRELMLEFTKVVLSETCEKLRLELCKEVK